LAVKTKRPVSSSRSRPAEGSRIIAMSASVEYTEYVLEMLAPIGPVRTGRFFGGVGILSGSVQFAMIMGNSLYFVVDDSTRPNYERASMAPFSYTTKKGRVQVRKYFELPEDILTDPEQLRLWANESKRIAAKDKKPSKALKRTRQKR
jgi:DNA transformation protein